MAFQTAGAKPEPQSLDDLIARLAEQEIVSGILLMGTTGTAALTPVSDYDLLVVFSALPVRVRIVMTWINERLMEIYCTTTRVVESVTTNAGTWPDGSEQGTLITWLHDGRIVHDRDGQFAAARERVRREPRPAMATDFEGYEARRKIAYNVAQLNRYLAGDDQVSGIVVDLRLLYSLFDVAFHYFTVRHIPWRGEKAAVRYWIAQDPAFLHLLRQCLAAPDRRQKATLYEQMAQHALAPVGGLWESGTTIIAIGTSWGEGTEDEVMDSVADGLRFWVQLIGVNASESAEYHRPS